MLEIRELPAMFVEELGVTMPVDEVYELYVNGSQIATLVASPGHEREMVLGFLLGARVIKSSTQVEEIVVEDKRIEVRASGDVRKPRIAIDDCVGMVELMEPRRSEVRIEKKRLEELVSDFHARNRYHGVQACGVYDIISERGVMAFDVSRFVAVAKALGAAELSSLKPEGSVLIASGRVSGDMISMALGVGISMVVGFKSIMYSALKTALLGGATVILFRGKEMKVLSYPSRVVD